MKKTKKKDFDKFLTRLFSMQRDCFKKGSRSYIEVRPMCCEDDGRFTIYVTAYNLNVNKWLNREDGTKEAYHFEDFPLYDFWSVEENENQLKKLQDFVTSNGDE